MVQTASLSKNVLEFLNTENMRVTASLLHNGPHGYHDLRRGVNTANDQRKISLLTSPGAMFSQYGVHEIAGMVPAKKRRKVAAILYQDRVRTCG